MKQANSKLIGAIVYTVAAVLCLVFLVGYVVSGLSESACISEPFYQSSMPINSEKTRFSSTFTGSIENRSTGDITVDTLHVKMRENGIIYTYDLKGFFLPATATYNVLETVETHSENGKIVAVSLSVDGEEDVIFEENLVDAISVGFTLLTLLFASLAFHSFKVWKLIKEEQKLFY